MPSSVIVLGSINTDLVVRSDRLPQPGETVLGHAFFRAAGGKGANQAVAAARLATSPVTLIGAVGDDELGKQAVSGLDGENLMTGNIKTVPSHASGVALIMVDKNGENCISVAPGANEYLLPADVERVPDDVFENAAVFLAPLESPLPTVAAALRRAKAFDLTTLLNPAPAASELIAHKLLQDVDIVTPNASEASALTGITVTDYESAITAARQLQQWADMQVIVTLGASGAVLVETDARIIAAQPAEAIDTTAAGDAFNGALAVALAEGNSLQRSAHLASMAAAVAVSRLGAQPSLPARRELADFH